MKRLFIALLAVVMLMLLTLPALAAKDTETPKETAEAQKTEESAAPEDNGGSEDDAESTEKQSEAPDPEEASEQKEDRRAPKKGSSRQNAPQVPQTGSDISLVSASNNFILARDARQTERAEGDVAAVGDDAEVSRGAGGDVFTAGRNVLVTDSEALQNVAAVGANINIHVKKARNIYAAGGDIDVQADEEALGVYVAGAAVTLGGKMTDAYIAAATVNLSGTVAENLVVRSNNVVFGPDTTVGGKITILSNKRFDLPASIDPSKVTYRAPGALGNTSGEGDIRWQAAFRKVALTIVVSGIIAAIILSLALNAMRGGFFRDRADKLRRYFWRDMLRGLAGVIVIPVIAVLLLVSVIGAPIGAVLLALYFVALYLSPIIAGLVLGNRIFPKLHRFLSGAITVCAIWLLMLVPYLGVLVGLLATLYGAGALISAIPPRHRRDRRGRRGSRGEEHEHTPAHA